MGEWGGCIPHMVSLSEAVFSEREPQKPQKYNSLLRCVIRVLRDIRLAAL